MKKKIIDNEFVRDIISKAALLWQDKRSWKVRALLAALASLALSFTFLFFGPLEIYVQNQQYLTFSVTSLIKAMSVLCGLVFCVVFLILILLRGKIFNSALSAVFAVTLCGYLQRNVLNIDHGSLDGSAIAWNVMSVPMITNLLVWFLVIFAVFLLLYFSRKIWAYTIQILCAFLIGAQGIAMLSFIGTDFTIKDNAPYINNAGIYSASSGENVVFFLLDRLDESYIEKIINENPDWKTNELADFTYYDNFTGSYTRTMPSVAYLLTGVECRYDIPFEEYFKKAWTTSSFLTDMRDAGYGTRVYSELAYVFGDAKYVNGRIDNISSGNNTVDYKQLYKYMTKLSAFSYAPEALKPFFWLYTGDLSSVNDKAHRTHDGEFWQGYREYIAEHGGITVDDSKGYFTFYHMGGAHDPHTLDANGFATPSSNQDAQITGNMKMIFNYIEQLKEKGLYDSTTIIISADHGITGSLEKLDHERLLGLMIKPANAHNDEMQVSSKQICQDNLRASIISYFNDIPDNVISKYGRTIEDIGEDEDIIRYFWMQAGEQGNRDQEFVTYEIKGDAKEFSNWKEIDRVPIKYPYYDTSKTQGL